MSNKRAVGQLWIDRQAPNGLKYYVDGKVHEIETVSNYRVSASIKAGTVVAIDKDSIKPAEFPKDLENVLGVCPKTVSAGDEVSILRNGVITLKADEISNVLAWSDISSNDENNKLLGAPVYWFIGRSYKENGSYKYAEPKFNKGCLTLSTPSGRRWGITSNDTIDPSFNVGYGNLPTVGTVIDYILEESTLKSLTIAVNVSRFEASLDWHWPYSVLNNSAQPTEVITGGKRLSIRHGLFCKPTTLETNYYAFRPRCFCNMVSLDNNDNENIVMAGVDNYYGLPESTPASYDPRTEIDFKGYDNKNVYVMGKVVYTFGKQFS